MTGVVVLCLVAAFRFDAFSLTQAVSFGGGERIVPDTFATVDHPFHATRGAFLLDALQQGAWPRWIGQHQGGYPVEFYPMGLAWLDVAVWALTFGTIPVLSAHKIAILIVFVAPIVGFWLIVRGDRLPPVIAVLGLAVHVVIPGFWTNGGSEELIGWGLATNVAGAVLAFIALGALARCALVGDRGMGLVAIGAIAAAVVTNPRAIFALAIMGIAIAICSFDREGARARAAVGRMSWVAVVGGLIAAPVLLPLVRYSDLYYFQRYQGYTSLEAYLDSSVLAVSLPILLLAIAGAVHALLSPTAIISRVVAVTALIYVAFTAALSRSELIQQLETPRLMPFQRLLLIALAVSFLGHSVRWVIRRTSQSTGLLGSQVAVLGVAAIVVVGMWGSIWTPPASFATGDPSSTAEPEFVSFEEAIRSADAVGLDGTAILVIGDENNWWHQQLWAPNYTDRPLFYDDWLWYWHEDHVGPKMPTGEHFYPDPARALTPEYFEQHGIGAVVVTSMPVPAGALDPREAATSVPELQPTDTVGDWDVYAVTSPNAIVGRDGGTTSSITVEDTSIRATIDGGEGDIIVRHNWFPRWQATVNGEAAEITRTDDGYMRIAVDSAGTLDIELSYGTTPVDWLARGVSMIGLAGLAVTPKVLRRLERGAQDAESERDWLSPPMNRVPSADTVQR